MGPWATPLLRWASARPVAADGVTVTTDALPLRRVTFAYPDDMDPAWIADKPEFAHMANGLSLLMPYAEPLFIKAVRSAFGDIDDELQGRTDDYIKQEIGHYTEHKHFNEIIRARHPAVARIEQWMKRTADWVTGRSRKFMLAFASGGEIMSFLLARWVDEHAGDLFAEAEPVVATLFLWHLAEEVEHKSAAFDVYEEIDGSTASLRVRHGARDRVARLVRVAGRVGHAPRRRSVVAHRNPPAAGPLGDQRRVRVVPGHARVRAAGSPPGRLHRPDLPDDAAAPVRPGHRDDAALAVAESHRLSTLHDLDPETGHLCTSF